jgi:hypothetical protein
MFGTLLIVEEIIKVSQRYLTRRTLPGRAWPAKMVSPGAAGACALAQHLYAHRSHHRRVIMPPAGRGRLYLASTTIALC